MNKKLKQENKVLRSKPLQRIIVIGPQHAGKTSIIWALKKGTFDEKYNKTIGVDSHTYTLKALDSKTKVQIFDTPGAERSL